MRQATTNLDRLRVLGEALHGERWQHPTARDLGIDSRQVRRWVAGEYDVPDGIIRDLAKIARARRTEIDKAIVAAG